jgi:hypothetical protein
MGYCEDMREMIGDSPLIIVRPSVAIINDKGGPTNKLTLSIPKGKKP